MIDTAFIRSIREGLKQSRKPKETGTDELSQEYKEMTPGQTDEALDPVNKDAVKKKFKNRKDKDIDNDGDVDSSDEYLHKRRKAISKAMKKEEVEEAHKGIRLTPELFKNVKKFGVELEKYAKKSGGIDKDDFMKVAAIAKKGMLPDKSDIPSDTDPRDKVLSMMAGIVGDEILLAFKGLSPSVDNYIKKTMKEETELDERKHSDYELYHKTFSGAMQHAYAVAKKRGYTVDKDDIDNKVATGPRKPSKGKTNRYILGTDKKQNLHVQVANLDNKRFELNMYIESVKEDEDLEKISKELAGASKMHMGQSKRIKKHLDKMKKEEVELTEAPSPNQAAIDRFMRGGGKITKIEPGLSKKGERQTAAVRKALINVGKKERELAKKDAEVKRRYIGKQKGGSATSDKEYRTPDYVSIKDIKKFPRSLTSGLGKIISGAKLQNDKFKLAHHGLIPGMGITFPGDSAPKLFIEYKVHIFLAGPEPGKIASDPKFLEPGVDTADYKHWMIVYVNEASTNNPALKGKVDWYQRKEFSGKTPDEVAKRTLQYLKTKVKRMANEELVVEREMTDNEMKKREEIVMKLKKKMPEFVKRYGDKAKQVMYATATKMAMGEELEPLETKKSKKKDKINLKPEMDENMRTLKDFRNKMQEHCGECGAMDHVEEGPADYLAKKGTFEVKYASSKKGPIKVSKFPSLEQAKKFLAQVKKEGMNGIISKGGKPIKASHMMMMKGKMNASYHKDKMNASYHKEENEVNEAITEQGVEYVESDFDTPHRLENAYPNLDVSFAKFMEEDLEGPYMFEGETYFFDRKMGSWFSVSGEDYVDEDMNKHLSHNFIKSELVRVN